MDQESATGGASVDGYSVSAGGFVVSSGSKRTTVSSRLCGVGCGGSAGGKEKFNSWFLDAGWGDGLLGSGASTGGAGLTAMTNTCLHREQRKVGLTFVMRLSETRYVV